MQLEGSNKRALARATACDVPVVLGNPEYYGTLAAVRSLGRAGVPVVTAGPSLLAPGRYSRYTSTHVSSPDYEAPEWSDWLYQFGRKGPRHAIYATSDAVSFALAANREMIGEVFDLCQPGLPTIMSLLDKGQMIAHAQAVGFDTPETWFPESSAEAVRRLREVGGEMIAKPRSQLTVRSGIKGMLMSAACANAVGQFDELLRHGAQGTAFAKQFPAAAMPMLQRYYPQALDGIYSLSGFRDESGELVVMRAARKVLQRPLRLGVGLCFQNAELDAELAHRTIRLCERIGYYGAFELEFIFVNGKALLIDFNGRFFNQLGFDVARGMDLPKLAYAAATGQRDALSRMVSEAQQRQSGEPLIFCNSFGMWLTSAAQRLFGRMSADEASRWSGLRKAQEGGVVDAVRDPGDPVPAYVDWMRQVSHTLRHPRSFIRQTASLNSSAVTATMMAFGAL